MADIPSFEPQAVSTPYTSMALPGDGDVVASDRKRAEEVSEERGGYQLDMYHR